MIAVILGHVRSAEGLWWRALLLIGAAAAAGPWPELGGESLLWRVPLAALALLAAGAPRSWQHWLVAGLVVCAFALDWAVPARRSPQVVAGQVSARVAEVGAALGEWGQSPELHALLTGAGGEATPEMVFAAARRAMEALPVRLDALVVVSERGLPVAWAGDRARLPQRLRPLGERTVVVERGIDESWVWWREAVFESGRAVGSLLAGARAPAGGARRLLGVSAGRAGEIVVVPGGGGQVVSAGAPLMQVTVRPRRPALGSQPGLAAVLAAVGFAGWLPLGPRVLIALGALATALLFGWVGPRWWLVVLAGALAVALGATPARRLPLWTRALVCAVFAGVLPWLARGLDVGPASDSLLWPGLVHAALLWALTVAIRSVARPDSGLHLVARVGAWVPLLLGVVLVHPLLAACGVGLVVWLGGVGGRLLLAALVAGGMVVTVDEAGRREALVADTDTTLRRLDSAGGLSRQLLDGLAAEQLGSLMRADAGERLVALGRAVVGSQYGQLLPGAVVEVVDPDGELAAVWGDTTWREEGEPVELGRRVLANGWWLRVVRPPMPHHLLAGLAAANPGQPVAVFDRAGAPWGRGATFRPLSPARAGAALAAGSSWGQVGVGERELPSYLRAQGDWVVAVPWVRLPVTGRALEVAAWVLWGALPLGVWAGRRRWRRWWLQRSGFLGRLRVLLAITTVLPVVMLAQILPAQWATQQERATLELGRAVSRSLSAPDREEGLGRLVREMDGIVAVYRSGVMSSCSRPDEVVLGRVSWLPPAEAFVRAVRGWREPVVESAETTAVYAPLQVAGEPVVVAALGLQVSGLSSRPAPVEWFVITGVLALGVALVVADRMGSRLARPLRRLVGAARRLEHGQAVPRLRVGRDEDLGALSRAFATMADGVQRREDELRAERDLRERVLATLSAAVMVVEPEGTVSLANPAACKLLGTSREIGFLAHLLPAPIAELAAGVNGGASIENVVQPADRPEMRWRVSVAPLGEAASRLLVVLEDLSELARAERLSSLAELARIAAHEVKNPLTPIRLWAEELQAALARGPEQVAAIAALAAGQILDRVEHLREVASSFGNLVALERWEPAVFDLLVVARQVAAEYGVLASRGISLVVEGGPSMVYADSLWVERAIRHLIENSARVLGESPGVVRVRVASETGGVVLAVADSGGGVPESLLGRLFEPHFSTTSEGSGLGLAVVARVLARAGGVAEACNDGKGLQVRLVFPFPPEGLVA